jgi:hypothetical protein
MGRVAPELTASDGSPGKVLLVELIVSLKDWI